MGYFWPPVLLWLLGSSIAGWFGFFQIKRLHTNKCKKRWLWIALSIGSGVFGFLFEKIIYSIPVPDDWYFVDIGIVIASISAVAAAGGLIFNAYERHKESKIARGTFWLTLEGMFTKHDSVHVKLRPGGEWTALGKKPEDTTEWNSIEDYMGLFEHCNIMIKQGIIDMNTFKKIFAYRINNILAHKDIVNAKLHDEKESWFEFIDLCKKLGLLIPSSS